MNLWEIILYFFWIFAFIAYLFALFAIIGDLFSDRALNGWWKAVWVLFLIFVPFLTALVYLIARGRGMAERSARRAQQEQSAMNDYIRTVASSSPTQDIQAAKLLLDSGAITTEEFEKLKTHAMSKHAATAEPTATTGQA